MCEAISQAVVAELVYEAFAELKVLMHRFSIHLRSVTAVHHVLFGPNQQIDAEKKREQMMKDTVTGTSSYGLLLATVLVPKATHFAIGGVCDQNTSIGSCGQG